MTKPLSEKFFGRFDVDASTGCWNWNRGMFSTGYGAIAHGKRTLKAHRVSYELHHGEIPDGLCVCHKCDNPKCVNPDHLFLGTTKDNTHDMIAKGRKVVLIGEQNPNFGKTGDKNPFFGQHHSEESKAKAAAQRTGEKSYIAKLNDAAAKSIFSRKDEDLGLLAAEFGVSKAAVWQVINGYSWNHVTGLPRKRRHGNEYQARLARKEHAKRPEFNPAAEPATEREETA